MRCRWAGWISLVVLGWCLLGCQERKTAAREHRHMPQLRQMEQPSTSNPVHQGSEAKLREKKRRQKMERYEALKRAIAMERKRLLRKWRSSNRRGKRTVLAQASRYMADQLLTRLLPAWLGVPWVIVDRQEPGESDEAFARRKSQIAASQSIENPYGKGVQTHCSLLITTTLKHLGLKVERYRLSWQLSSNMIQSLTFRKRLKWLIRKPMRTFLQHVKRQGRGVYLVGLDVHTGFVVYGRAPHPSGRKRPEDVYFCHADYGNAPQVVRCELATQSPVLTSSRVKVLGKLFSLGKGKLNWRLARAWLLQQPIRTIGRYKQ